MIDKMPGGGSFVEYLNAVAAAVPASLISPSRFSTMAAVARMLPATLAHNTFGFECRMGNEHRQADFSVQATAAYGRDILAGTDPTTSLPAALLTDPIWRRVQDLTTRWAEPRSGLNRAVDNVWLEFDLDGPVPGIPRPSVFLGLALYGQDETVRQAHEARLHGCRTTVETMTRLLTGHDLPARVRQKLTGCLERLWLDEHVFQVGLMLARGAEAVRLCVRLRSTERTIEYLSQVGWAGRTSGLRGILGLARLVDYTWLDLDVGETVHPKIGLECYFERHRQPRCEPRWATFLDALVQNGLCTAATRDALLAYPGHTDENAPGVPWPSALRRTSHLLDGRSLSTFVRTLHHVKITYRPGRPLEAKAYLAANHYWHTPGPGVESAVLRTHDCNADKQ